MAVKLEFLKTACYFSRMGPPVLEEVNRFVFERSYASGEVFLWEGEKSDVLYFVISGLVKLFATSVEGRELIIRLAYGGDSINDEGIFDDGPNFLSAMTMTPVVLYGLERRHLGEIQNTHPQLNARIMEVLASRQRHLVRLTTEMVFKNVTGRLACFLLESDKLTSAMDKQHRITQQEMASITGTVRELVSRSLRELEMMGSISMERNQIIITNKNQLLKLCEE